MNGHGSAPEKGVRVRSNNRRAAILDAAAYRFRRQGFSATTMREVASDADMLAGSMYYHFPSKEALLLAVHEEGVRRIALNVDGALSKASADDPWARLEAGLAAHLESLLGSGDYAQVVIRDLPADNENLRSKLIALRDDYEQRFRNLTDALAFGDPTQASWVRLLLMGAANWSRTWYRPDSATPSEIAHQFVALIRCEPTGGNNDSNN